MLFAHPQIIDQAGRGLVWIGGASDELLVYFGYPQATEIMYRKSQSITFWKNGEGREGLCWLRKRPVRALEISGAGTPRRLRKRTTREQKT